MRCWQMLTLGRSHRGKIGHYARAICPDCASTWHNVTDTRARETVGTIKRRSLNHPARSAGGPQAVAKSRQRNLRSPARLPHLA